MKENEEYAQIGWTVNDLDRWDVTEKEAEAIIEEDWKALRDVTVSAGNEYLEAIMAVFNRIGDDEDIDDDDDDIDDSFDEDDIDVGLEGDDL